MKPWLIIGAFGLLLAGQIIAIKAYGSSQYRQGTLAQLQAQTNTDLQHLTAWAEQQQQINQQVVDGLNGLNTISQNPDAGPNVSSAIEWVRNTRKPQGNKN